MAETHRPMRTEVVPEICLDGAAAALNFYEEAFGAEELFRHALDNGRVLHAEVSFDGFVIFVVDDFPEMHGGRGTSPTAIGGTPVCLHRDVPDVDASVERAVAAGATLLHGPEDMFWGGRPLRSPRRPLRPPLVAGDARTGPRPRGYGCGRGTIRQDA